MFGAGRATLRTSGAESAPPPPSTIARGEAPRRVTQPPSRFATPKNPPKAAPGLMIISIVGSLFH